MSTEWPEAQNASARDGRWMAHVLACPHEECRAARHCRIRWTSARRCPVRTGEPPDDAEAAAFIANVNRELHRIAFEEDDQSRTEPVGQQEHRRRIAAAFERARKGMREGA